MNTLGKPVRPEGLKDKIRAFFTPLPIHQKSLGFQPNFYIRFLRVLSRALIGIFRLNGQNRFSNEFVQQLDPKVTVELTNGKSLVYRTGHGRLLWRAKYAAELDEPMLDEWLGSFSKNDTFFDVGACVGAYSMRAALQGSTVYAIEAEINNLQVLYENIMLNDLFDQIQPIGLPLHDKTGTATFFVRSHSKGDAMHSLDRQAIYLDEFSGNKVSTLTMSLDDMISTFDLPYPTKLKIDVDSNELLILKGARETLKHCNEVYVEVCLKYKEHQEILNYMEKSGFVEKQRESEIRPFLEKAFNILFVKRDSA
jgi:FkbM family methyltransferase